MIEETIVEVFAAGGCRGSLSVREIDGPRRLSVAGGELAVAASTFKIAIGLEFFCRAAEGDVDPAERVAVSPAEASPGGQGLCITEDPVEISLRDTARLMLTISDNTATDVLIRRVGIERVRARLAGLGLTGFHLPGTIRYELDTAARAAGFAGWEAMAARIRHAPSPQEGEAVWRRVLASPGMRPGRISSATADDLAALLRAVWRDEAGPAQACSDLRRMMGQQRLTRKIAAGFGPHVQVVSKSGTVPGGVSNDAGVVAFPDGRRYAIAVLTRPLTPGAPTREDVLGTAARVALDHLRAPGTPPSS
ncbi:class A beta-lactamase-related serine hydrolase [Streptomyces sp. ATE26]|uniref:serine hydrolase n=1 Tax=Streptomyces sp. ATE26 TaxID=2954237 RepID=UPI0024825B9F|nr:serine hydrolase [Streptomyces sp. ATE26]MDI1453962.1 class A beta-lactamase-related serine hydrolase [Streptomyces sp. ATE26]